MTEQQDFSVFIIRIFANAVFATDLRTRNLHDHLTGTHLDCVDYHFWGSLLHGSHNRIDLG